MAAKQGFLMYYSKGDAIGTRVSVRYRRSGRLSEVVVKRGSTVYVFYLFDLTKPMMIPTIATMIPVNERTIPIKNFVV